MLQFIISTIALLLISVTMLLRANDLKLKGFRWDVRRLGFVLAGFSPGGIIVREWYYHLLPDWYTVCFRLGILLVFMTTPYLIPWHKWLWRDGTFDPRQIS